ncbi:MAG: ABC transporter substrate-binding protein [Planctomycetota bacterium]
MRSHSRTVSSCPAVTLSFTGTPTVELSIPSRRVFASASRAQRLAFALLTVLAAGWTEGVLAAQVAPSPERVLRLGVLYWHDSPNDRRAAEGIRRALDLGRRRYEWREVSADSDRERARSEIAALRAQGIDLLFALGTEASLIAADAVRDLPIVFTAVTNPVESQVVSGWSGSRRNLAGNSNWIDSATVLRVFEQAVPRLRTLGVLRSENTGVVSAAELAGMRAELAARPAERAIDLREAIVKEVAELGAAVDELAVAGVDAIWIPIDFLVYENIEAVAAAAARRRLPLVSSSLRGVQAAAVAGLVVDYELLGERAALIALDILERGKSPGEIPIGRMQSYRVVVNLDACRRLGHRVPLSLLAVADLVIAEGDPRKEGGR